jgi:hypothetical protein
LPQTTVAMRKPLQGTLQLGRLPSKFRPCEATVKQILDTVQSGTTNSSASRRANPLHDQTPPLGMACRTQTIHQLDRDCRICVGMIGYLHSYEPGHEKKHETKSGCAFLDMMRVCCGLWICGLHSRLCDPAATTFTQCELRTLRCKQISLSTTRGIAFAFCCDADASVASDVVQQLNLSGSGCPCGLSTCSEM